MKNCTNELSITAPSNTVGLGGICYTLSSTGVLENCSNKGTLTSKTNKDLKELAFEGTGTIKDCSHTDLTKTEAKDATCIDEGNTAYWTCENCNKVFSDEAATTETTVEETVIVATGEHTYENGVCTVCGAEDPTEPEDVIDGLVEDEDGVWRYHVNGPVDYDFTGLVPNEYGTWYIRNGQARFDYTGNIKVNGQLYAIQNGKVV